MKHKYLISIVGPTAIGKTSLAIDLANFFNTEILSSDSRQFFKEMTIGTAVPSDKELESVKHYFIQNRSIKDDYNVGAFERDALELLNEKFKTHDFFVMVGGSGLYVDAVLKGLDNFPEVGPEIRKKLNQDFEKEGIQCLQERLKRLDLISYQKIDLQNKQRLIRALEICEGTGKPFSSFWLNKKKERKFKTIKIGIQADREMVYQRINQRVDQMISEGLIDEARSLYPLRTLNALQTVGYRELFTHFDDKCTLDEAIAEIKKNTRRFAKRQGTWFKRDSDIQWFDFRQDRQVIIQHIEKLLK